MLTGTISDLVVGGVQVDITIELHGWASWQCLSHLRMDIPVIHQLYS